MNLHYDEIQLRSNINSPLIALSLSAAQNCPVISSAKWPGVGLKRFDQDDFERTPQLGLICFIPKAVEEKMKYSRCKIVRGNKKND